MPLNVKKLICIPGNAGTEEVAENIKEDISNFNGLYKIIKNKEIDLEIGRASCRERV